MNHQTPLSIIYGSKPKPHEKEFLEMMNYESDKAESEVAQIKGPFGEPWLNAVNAYEPVSMPAFDRMLAVDALRDKIRGKILDVAAGSCWLSAKLSLLPQVEEVYAIEMSEKFLRTGGTRCMKYLNADFRKVKLVASNFNDLPLESGMADCAMLFAALHHSLSPIKTLQEVARCVKPGGYLMILENPPAAIRIRQARKEALALSEHVSEIASTREELEYFMRAAQIGPFEVFTFDILSRPGLRMRVHKVLRRLGVEHLILNPPTYLWLITRK